TLHHALSTTSRERALRDYAASSLSNHLVSKMTSHLEFGSSHLSRRRTWSGWFRLLRKPQFRPQLRLRPQRRSLIASSGLLSAALAGRSPALGDVPVKQNATADALIVLWMAGGQAQTETFDPKTYTPFTPGMKASEVLSTFPAIDTKVDNIKFSKGLERMASV